MTTIRAGMVTLDVDGVIFDKDGTLIDLDATWAPIAVLWIDAVALGDQALARALDERLGLDREHGLLVPESILAAGTTAEIGTASIEVLHRAGITDDEIAERAAAGEAALARHGEPRLFPLADLDRLTADLIGHGLALALVTSDDRSAALDLVNTFDLADRFVSIVGGDDVDHGKPAPDALERAAAEMGIALDRIVMVGDSIADRDAARAAGCAFVAVGHGDARTAADAVVMNVGEITVIPHVRPVEPS